MSAIQQSVDYDALEELGFQVSVLLKAQFFNPVSDVAIRPFIHFYNEQRSATLSWATMGRLLLLHVLLLHAQISSAYGNNGAKVAVVFCFQALSKPVKLTLAHHQR